MRGFPAGYRRNLVWETDQDGVKRDEARARELGGEFAAAIKRWRVQRGYHERKPSAQRRAA